MRQYPSQGRYITVADSAVVNPEITSATMGEFPENEVDFDDHTPLVFHGTNLAYNAAAGDTLKIELRPDKGEATAILDQLKSITPSADGGNAAADSPRHLSRNRRQRGM